MEKKKIDSSREFIVLYRKKYNDGLVEHLFEVLKENEDVIDELDADWLYISKINGVETSKRHDFFIKLYLRSPQNKNIKTIEGKCSICGKTSTIRDVRLPFYSLEISNYNFGMASNKIEKSPIKICEDCELKISSGWNYLDSIFINNYVLVPEPRNKSFEGLSDFFRIASENTSNFERLNNLISEREIYENMNFRFLVTRKQQSKLNIIRSVSNYKLFAQKFENLFLRDNEDELKYYHAKLNNLTISRLENFFDLERLLKYFFVDENNYFLKKIYGKTFHFFHLYTDDLPKNLNNKFKHLLYAHRDELFSFIYETNIKALSLSTLKDIVLNFLKYEIRKQNTSKRFSNGIVRNKIVEGLNYFYFLKTKIYKSENMKSKTEELKDYFESFDEESKQKIKETIAQEENSFLLYYMLGQFIKKIDDYRYNENKNSIFNKFIDALNRKNVKQRFAEDILKNQNYYIGRLNPKAKFIFDLMVNDLNDLFQKESFSEVLISLISGYYSKNFLKPKIEVNK